MRSELEKRRAGIAPPERSAAVGAEKDPSRFAPNLSRMHVPFAKVLQPPIDGAAGDYISVLLI
jgi:hypothetical protein